MPRNGTGSYALPAGNPVVTGTVISSSTQNTTMSDVAAALTQSLSKDGQTVATANLPMGGFKHTGVADGSATTDYASYGQLTTGTVTMSNKTLTSPIINGGTITGITDLAVADGGTGASTAAGALTNLGAYAASNPNGYTNNTGTVSSVSGTGTASGLTLSGTVTTSGSLTLSGTASVAALSTASGSAPSYSARAWVNFDGTGTVAIRASGNVSSITDNGVGDYTVNFTTAMPDTNYAMSGSVDFNTGGSFAVDGNTTTTKTISAYRIWTWGGGSLFDFSIVSLFITR